MKDARKKNVTLGIFITIGFFLLAGMIYFLGSQKSMFGSKVNIVVFFKTVNGLQSGANVRFSGLTIGTVKGVTIANDSLVKAVLLIDDEAARYVKKDAYATIESDGLMGNKIVSISGGASEKYIADDDVINSKEPLSIEDMMASFKRASDNANALTKNLAEISSRINSGKGLIGRLVSDTVMVSNLENTMLSIENSTRNIDQITREMKQAAQEINHGDGLIARIIHDDTLSHSFESIVDSMAVASKELSATSSNLKAFSEKLNDDQGVVHTLIDDPEAAQDVEATLYNLNEGTANIDEVLETINNSWILNLFSGKDKKKNN